MSESPNDPTHSALSDQSLSLLKSAAKPRAMSVVERKIAAQSVAKIAATPAVVAGGYSLAKIALASVATIATVGAAATLARSRPQEPTQSAPITRPAQSAPARPIEQQRVERAAPTPPSAEQPPARATAAPALAVAVARAPESPSVVRAAPTQSAAIATGPTIVAAAVAPRVSIARRGPTPQPANTSPASAPVIAQASPTVAQVSNGAPLPSASGSGSHSLSGGVYNEPPEQRETTALEQVFSVVGNDPRRAMAMLEAFDREFPRSRLRDEREFLGVLVLDRLGRRDEARTRARSMLERSPTSMFAPRLRRLLEQAP